MAFPPSFIDELTARNPIEDVVGQYVNLKRSGANLFGLCPFHGEKTPSFSVAPDKGIYYCFGCHKGGGVINFMMEIEGLSYPDAVRALAKRCIRVAEAFDLHHEVDDPAALVAAEAVVDPLVRGYGKGRGLLPVEGAETEQVGAGALQAHILAYHFLNGISGSEFINK